jgi:cell division protein FtsW
LSLGYTTLNDRVARMEYDRSLLWITLLLLGFGIVMVYSASIAIAEAGRNTAFSATYYLSRHSVFVLISIIAGAVVFQIPIRILQQMAPYLFVLGVVLLILVLIPGIGHEVNGSRRWLPLGFVNLQPSEIVKLSVLLYASDYTARKAALMHSFQRGFLPLFGVMVVTGSLLLFEPDYGALGVVTVIAMGILFLGGMYLRLFVTLIVGLVFAFVMLVWTSPYRMRRVIGFMDPWADPFGTGYQLSHALIAFGRGEWLGVGLGASVEKLFYLPEAHTDFLLAVIAEELGFIGVLILILMFAWIVWRAFRIGKRATDLERPFPALVAFGIGLWMGVQVFINMGVNMGILPTKGLTLPLLSFGGSAVLTTCCAIGILLRIDWENRQLVRGFTV